MALPLKSTRESPPGKEVAYTRKYGGGVFEGAPDREKKQGSGKKKRQYRFLGGGYGTVPADALQRGKHSRKKKGFLLAGQTVFHPLKGEPYLAAREKWIKKDLPSEGFLEK